MEKVECKACSATVDKSIEFCSSCGEWLGLSIKDIENSDAKTEPEVTRRVRPPEELLSQPLSNYGATSLPTRNEVPGIRAVFFLAIIIPLIAAASYYYNQNIAEEVIEEIQVVEQSTTTSTSTTVQSLMKRQFPFSCSASSSLGDGWSCEKIYDNEPSSWQDKSLECADATLEFTFSKDVYFEFLTYENLDDSKICLYDNIAKKIFETKITSEISTIQVDKFDTGFYTIHIIKDNTIRYEQIYIN